MYAVSTGRVRVTYVGYVKRATVTKPHKKTVYQVYTIRHKFLGQRDLFANAVNLLS